MNTNFYTQLMPFFGYDGRGTQFVNLNYKGINYESPINNISYPDTIRGEPIFQLMVAKNYDNKTDDQLATDIHQEFVDFIINLALSHRNIDKPTSSNVNLMTNKTKFQNRLESNDTAYYKIILSKIVGYLSGVVPSFGTTGDQMFKNVKNMDDVNKIMNYLVKLDPTIINLIKDVGNTIIKNTFVFSQNPNAITSDAQFYIDNIIPAINNTILTTLLVFYITNPKLSVPDLDVPATLSNQIDKFKIIFISVINESLDKLQNKPLSSLFNGPITADKTQSVFDNIFRSWGSLENDVRKFYISHILLMFKGPTNNWLVLNNFDKFGKPENYRINFKKSKMNKSRTIFSETLPFIPSVTHNVWFTNSSNKLDKIDLSKLSELDKKSILKTIYDGVYASGKSFQVMENGKSKSYSVNTKSNIKPRFDINYQKFVSGVINEFMKYQQIPAVHRDNFDDLLVDLTTNIVYNKDDKGLLYQVVNGNKVYYDATKLESDLKSNCYGTYIKDDDNDCAIVSTCILNNSPQNLVRCLDSLRQETLFDIAKSDINSINPEIMRRIVKTFGFEIRLETDGLYRPSSMEDWMRSPKIPSEVKSLVQSNRKLKIYIGEIINIIRKNPIMLQENVAQQRKEYSKMNMSYFVQPLQLERPIHNENIYRDMLMKTNMPQNFEIPFFTSLSNVNNTGVQYGGVSDAITKEIGDKTSEKLKKLFDNIFRELVDSGKELKDEDKLRIYNAIEKVGKLEAQLNTFYEEIQMFANMSKMMKDTNVIEPTDLSEIHDFTNNKDMIEEAHNKIRNKIQKTISSQYTILDALYMAQLPLIRMIGF